MSDTPAEPPLPTDWPEAGAPEAPPDDPDSPDGPATRPGVTDTDGHRVDGDNSDDDDAPGASRSLTPYSPADAAGAMLELRRLLVGPDHEQIKSLARRLEDLRRRAEDVSRVLPDAIRLHRDPDRRLGNALSPHLEEAFRASIHRNKDQIVDVMSPVMGPAIRRAVTDALARMVQTLNSAIEHSLSPQSIRWRFEARRTGIPFAEVVLRHTLQYRVDEVFLVHRETGLLLQHVARQTAVVKDADMVSAMLTAIRDFCRDSFEGADDAALQDFRVGDRTIWVRQGTKAILAVALWGTAPEGLHSTLEEAQEQIHGTFSEDLDAFSGDTAPFEKARPILEGLLTQGTKTAGKKKPTSPLLWLGAAAALIVLGFWVWTSVRDARRWDRFLARLRSEPGIVLTDADQRGGRYYVTGLRDPKAADPAALFADAMSISPARVPDKLVAHWQSYYAASPEAWVKERAEAALAGKPESVQLDVRGGALVLTGTASQEWIATARAVAAVLPGIGRFDDRGVTPIAPRPISTIVPTPLPAPPLPPPTPPPAPVATEPGRSIYDKLLVAPATAHVELHDGILFASGHSSHEWARKARDEWRQIEGATAYDDRQLIDEDSRRAEELARMVEGTTLPFVTGTAQLGPGQDVQVAALAQTVLDLLMTARRADLLPSVLIVGDATGEEAKYDWVQLSRGRADVVKNALIDNGVPPGRVRAVGSSAMPEPGVMPASRPATQAAGGPATGPATGPSVESTTRPVPRRSVVFTVFLQPLRAEPAPADARP